MAQYHEMVSRDGLTVLCPMAGMEHFAHHCLAECAMIGRFTKVAPDDEYMYSCKIANADVNSTTISAPLMVPKAMKIGDVIER